MIRKCIAIVGAIGAMLAAAPAIAANNFAVKDGNAALITKCSVQQLDGSQADCNVLKDASGNSVNPATKEQLTALIAAVGSPLQVGGSIGNSAFGISGTLPAFAAPPTVNLGSIGGASTAALQTTANTSLAAISTAINLTTPSTAYAAITPNDSVALATQPKALFIGSSGNLAVKGSDGVSATFAVAAGQILPIRPAYVLATGTTASGIVGLN